MNTYILLERNGYWLLSWKKHFEIQGTHVE